MKTKLLISVLGFFFIVSCENETSVSDTKTDSAQWDTTDSGQPENDSRISVAREHVLNEMLLSQAFRLGDFKKTNGYDIEEKGMKIYVLEWEAQVSVDQEIIATVRNNGLANTEGRNQLTNVITKDGSGLKTYYSWERAMSDYPDTRKLYPGTIIKLTGECKLQKTENGWRVIEKRGGEFKTSEIINEGNLKNR